MPILPNIQKTSVERATCRDAPINIIVIILAILLYQLYIPPALSEDILDDYKGIKLGMTFPAVLAAALKGDGKCQPGPPTVCDFPNARVLLDFTAKSRLYLINVTESGHFDDDTFRGDIIGKYKLSPEEGTINIFKSPSGHYFHFNETTSGHSGFRVIDIDLLQQDSSASDKP